MTPDWLTYQQAADLLTVSPATVRRLVRSGALRAVALTARCHRVDAVSVRAYLRTSQIKPSYPCPSGRTEDRGVGASCAAATSVRAALELAKRQVTRMPLPGAS